MAISDPAARVGYLDVVCGEDAGLRAEVERLLKAHAEVGDFLENPAIRAPDSPVGEGPGDVVGRYKLLEQIGEGGFGVVFMAEQLEPIRRRVALKIVKPGMDTRQVIVRFEAERQALALMEHPNIAQVFDAGATDSGRPFFVMELVRGVPITQYCDANALAPADRLALFMTVCAAVEHAHGKGIIHRDLKPSNVLVTLHDGKPVPKIIDFGTAKALDRPLTDQTLFTAFGRLIGTPAYMSPEQAEMSGLPVDRRADVYALGVLLYELLTGTTPLEAERLRAAAFEEMMRIIRHEAPPKPSTRVSTLGERATEVARRRQVDPELLARTLRGDLDRIVMKALEKARGQRYNTAAALAEDLQRHLRHQPVRARPPSAAYRLGRFARRHRPVLVTAAGVGAVLLAMALYAGRQHRDAHRLAAAAAAVSPDPARARTGEQLIQGVLHVEKEAALSPDETMLAYVDTDAPDWDLWVLDLKTGQRRNLTQSETHHPGAFEVCPDVYLWSPDSTRLAYAWADENTTPSARVIDVNDPVPRVLHTMVDRKTYYVPEAWSHDGRQILCRKDRPKGVALLDAETGEIRDLGVEEHLKHPRLSPDNRYLVFCHDDQVHLLETATNRVTQLTTRGKNTTPIWAPNDPVILFSSDRLGSWDLWGIRIENGRPASQPFPVRYGIGSFEKRLAASGALIVHRPVPATDGYTVAEGAPTGDVAALAPFPGRVYLEVNGRLCTLISEDGQAVVRAVGVLGQPSTTLHAGRRWYLQVRNEPGSNESADPPRQQLIALTAEDPDRPVILLHGVTRLAPSPACRWATDAERGLTDGRVSWVVTGSGPPAPNTPPPGVYAAPVAFDEEGNITGLAQVPSTPLAPGGAEHDWSPDGTRMVYVAGPRQDSALHLLDTQTGASRRLTEGAAPAWSPDGSRIAFRRGYDAICTIQPDGDGLRTVAQRSPPGAEATGYPVPGYQELVWAPDSRSLLYGYLSFDEPAREAYRIPAAGGEPIRMTRSILDGAIPVAWLDEARE